MSELGHFVRLLKAPFGDRVILLTAFLLTVFINVTVAISVGMILASFLFMKQMSQLSKTVSLSKMFGESQVDFPEKSDPDDISKKVVPRGVEVYEIQGPLFFGAAHILRDLLSSMVATAKVFILRMRSVPVLDASGMYGIEEFHNQCKKHNIALLLSGVHGQMRQRLKKFGLLGAIGEHHICPNIDIALTKAEQIVAR